jgi:hypothetical protein
MSARMLENLLAGFALDAIRSEGSEVPQPDEGQRADA